MKTLLFEINKIELVEAANSSQFAKARVDFFASGNNAHGMPVSKETLIKYADTILGKPLVYVIQKSWLSREDFGGHDRLSVPLGFFSGTKEDIQFRELEDGRTMASATALIWKKYSVRAMDIFNGKGDSRPVSVEMIIANQDEDTKEIYDFVFTACTILGTKVTPAIKDAELEIIEFSKDKTKYEEDIAKFSSVDFSIPEEIKVIIKGALETQKQEQRNPNPVMLANANYMIKNNKISPDKVRSMLRYHDKHKKTLNFSLCGGVK